MAIESINDNASEVVNGQPNYHVKTNKVYADKSREAIDHRKSVTEIRQQSKPLLEQVKEIKMVKADFEMKLKILRETLETIMGPFKKKIQYVLDGLKLERQVYHSGALVGNDVKKIMKKAVIKELNACFKPITVESISGALGQFSTHKFRQKLFVLHKKVQSIFELVNLTRPLCKHEVSLLTVRCYSLGNWLPSIFWISI